MDFTPRLNKYKSPSAMDLVEFCKQYAYATHTAVYTAGMGEHIQVLLDTFYKKRVAMLDFDSRLIDGKTKLRLETIDKGPS